MTKSPILEPIEDLIKISKMPNANMELLMEDCYQRGLRYGEKLTKKIIIDFIKGKRK